MSRIGCVFQLLRAGWVLTREGVLSALPGEQLSGTPLFVFRIAKILTRRQAKKQNFNKRLAQAITRLGPSYVKLGQFLATRPDIVGRNMANELSILQDRMDMFSKSIAVAIIEKSFGQKITEIFYDFKEPVAAASIAQVHPAFIEKEGTLKKVAVKIIRPKVRESFARDLESWFFAAHFQERLIPALRRLKPVDVVATLAQTTRIEMDLRLEAAALCELAENTMNDNDFRVPWVDWERTNRDVVTMEWVDGIKLDDLEALKKAGHNSKTLAVNLVQAFLRHTLRDGFFHADMHPGNLLVENNGTIVALDLGITGRLGKKERRFLAEILHGFIVRDFSRIAEVHLEAGYVPDKYTSASFAQAIRAIGEPIHGCPAEKISMAKLLTLLFEITETFDMETRPELLMLQKTMIVVEGVARTLDPAFDMWKTAEPIVSDWMILNLGPSGVIDEVYENGRSLRSLFRSMPEILKRGEKISRLIESSLDKAAHWNIQNQRSEAFYYRKALVLGNIALWVIAFSCLYIVWKTR